jgi:general transcription factor 3C polypeptide 5 (transcription factor C subunit 1)
MDSESSGASHGLSEAPEHKLPSTAFYSVEYPGYVKSASVPLAVRNLGGQDSLDNAFKRTASKTEALVELHLRPGNPFAHPIPGDVVATNNILLKVVKRKRRKLVDGEHVGEYTAEVVGVIPKTVRFRSKPIPSRRHMRSSFDMHPGMADYQYQPDMNDPVAKLRLAMDNMDGESLGTR